MIFNVDPADRYKSGIYKIHSIYDNRVYIGCSENFNVRFNVHNSKIRTGKHKKEFIDLCNKNGFDSLIFSIIELCHPLSLNEREIFYINQFKSCDPLHGFNKVMPLDTEKWIRTR